MSLPQGHILAVFVGGPKTLRDERGEWRSSIARDSVSGPAKLEAGGFVGDRSTQPFHGTPDSAVCIHSMSHYLFWNRAYGMALKPGAVGENLTLDGLDDGDVCIGDIYLAGSARIQISGSRTPCENQARHIGRLDWVQLTLQELRTGIYARVMAPGTLQAGDRFILESRPNPDLSVLELNRCYFHAFDAGLARRYMDAEGLAGGWKRRLRKKALEAGIVFPG